MNYAEFAESYFKGSDMARVHDANHSEGDLEKYWSAILQQTKIFKGTPPSDVRSVDAIKKAFDKAVCSNIPVKAMIDRAFDNLNIYREPAGKTVKAGDIIRHTGCPELSSAVVLFAKDGLIHYRRIDQKNVSWGTPVNLETPDRGNWVQVTGFKEECNEG